MLTVSLFVAQHETSRVTADTAWSYLAGLADFFVRSADSASSPVDIADLVEEPFEQVSDAIEASMAVLNNVIEVARYGVSQKSHL